MDETGLQLDVKVKKIVAAKESRYLHMHSSGNRETVIARVKAAGGFVPPHILKEKNSESTAEFSDRRCTERNKLERK